MKHLEFIKKVRQEMLSGKTKRQAIMSIMRKI